MANRSRQVKTKGQAVLEVAIVLIVIMVFLFGIVHIWLWANKQFPERQVAYNNSRIIAGTSGDIHLLMWPVYKPGNLTIEEAVPDSPLDKARGN